MSNQRPTLFDGDDDDKSAQCRMGLVLGPVSCFCPLPMGHALPHRTHAPGAPFLAIQWTEQAVELILLGPDDRTKVLAWFSR